MTMAYMANPDYWKVYDNGATIQRSLTQSDRGEKNLRRMWNRTAGVRFHRIAAGTSSSTGLVNGSTTLTDDNTLALKLSAGELYELEFYIPVTQATAADGYKVALSVSGTQTNSVAEGWYQAFDSQNNTYDEIRKITGAISSNLAFTATGTGGPGFVKGKIKMRLQSDATVKFQLAEQATAGGGAGAIFGVFADVQVRTIR